MDVLGLPLPDAGPVFRGALVVHIAAGLTRTVTGAVAAFSRKGGRRHLRFGRIYLWGLGVVFSSMTVLSVIRWSHNAHLFVIGAVAFALALMGYLSRRRRPRVHIAGLGGSYIALLTGFYVANGPHLPGWDRLPAWALWILPSLIGLPMIARAIGRRLPAKGATS